MTNTVERLMRPPQIEPDAERCPFCGCSAEIEYWHGGSPDKRMFRCSGDACDVLPSVTGETRAEALARWNRRA